MNTIRSLISFTLFLVLGIGFFVLIKFEIDFGIAGGKFGGTELKSMPGTFWFFIEIQVLSGLWSLVNALKELRFLSGKRQPGGGRLTNSTAVYWLLATLLIMILNLLGVWSAFEMVFTMYKLLKEYEMPDKAIIATLFLLAFSVLCYIYYSFLFRTLADDFYPKARLSFKLLTKKK